MSHETIKELLKDIQNVDSKPVLSETMKKEQKIAAQINKETSVKHVDTTSIDPKRRKKHGPTVVSNGFSTTHIPASYFDQDDNRVKQK